MKITFLLIATFSLAALFSCNKKEVEENNQFIVGSWVANFETISGCSDVASDIQQEIGCSDTYCIEFTFEQGGIYTANITNEDGTLGEQGTFTLDIDNISLCEEDEGEIFCKGGPYSVNPTTLTFSTTDIDTGCVTTWTFEKMETGA